jgi:carbon-monoxide dehydrogenase medium subunit
MSHFEYLRPKDLTEAIAALREDGICPIAGGTNLLVDIRAGITQPKAVLDIGILHELKEIDDRNGFIQVGACLTMKEIADSALIRSKIPILVQAALSVGGPQIRNRATLGGNIVSASPAADVVVSLVALNTEIILRESAGVRTLPLEEFFLDSGQTQIRRDELLTYISFKAPNPDEKGIFFKLGRRTAMAISIVNLGIMIKIDQSSKEWQTVRIALGAVAPTVIRAREAENVLSGQRPEERLFKKAAKVAALESSPISDIRASADYRKAMVEVAVEECLIKLAGGL